MGGYLKEWVAKEEGRVAKLVAHSKDYKIGVTIKGVYSLL
jgi:hypothetical protein